MKHLLSILLLFAFSAGVSIDGIAQKDPAQMSKRELRKKLKSFYKNPETYKKFKQNIEEKKSNLADIEKQLQAPVNTEAIEKEIAAKTQEEQKLKAEIERLKNEKKETTTVIKKETNAQGTVYKVQVEITDEDLYKEFVKGEKKPVFTGDMDSDGLKKYTLGYFQDKTEADKFVKILSGLFVKEAKVVTYTNGQRVD
ncbi:hypothetical protein [Microscilla marina]|uniref:SPOR domain-containing protein n=1 Tax=Microscilla marina ATCC 23134 TaxID=313606 RepID=A1ZEF8_MICM2|nr:hypothetical protein [Microscilla marina]EAY31466.1 hypothetical protein M23134_04299 [Microscilla marina ATCC 23134]